MFYWVKQLILLKLILIFCCTSFAELTLEQQQALQVLESHQYNEAQVLAKAPQALAILSQVQDPHPTAKGFVQVFVGNGKGGIVPHYVDAQTWNNSIPAGCSRAQMQIPLLANQGQPCRRRVVTTRAFGSRTAMTMEKINNEWKVRCDGGDCPFQRKPQQQEPAKCHFNHLLPPGVSWQTLVQDPNFNCRSSIVRHNDFLALACNLHWEARSEGHMGKKLVAEVTINRARGNALTNKNDPTIHEVVFAKSQFSWTNPKVEPDVRIGRQPADRRAWLEALTLAAGSYNLDSNKVPQVVDPMLQCYRYYVSTKWFSNLSQLPGTLIDIYQRSMATNDSALQPVCVGNHVFMRDPNNSCDLDRHTDAEHDDKDMAFRNGFYQGCLKQDSDPGPTDNAQTPIAHNLCRGPNLTQAMCAQTNSFNTTNVGGQPIYCSSGSASGTSGSGTSSDR